MAKPTKKQEAVSRELVVRTLHALDELNVPYAVVIEGIDCVFTNEPHRHALSILRDACEFHDKVWEKKVEDKADKLFDRESYGGGDRGAAA